MLVNEVGGRCLVFFSSGCLMVFFSLLCERSSAGFMGVFVFFMVVGRWYFRRYRRYHGRREVEMVLRR